MTKPMPTMDEIEAGANSSSSGPPWEDNQPIRCVVEAASSLNSSDPQDEDYFETKLGIMSGNHKGEKYDLRWSKTKKNGQWNWDTLKFLRTLIPNEQEPLIYQLVGKCFVMTPKLNKFQGKDYWNMKDPKLSEVPAEYKEEVESLRASLEDDLPF